MKKDNKHLFSLLTFLSGRMRPYKRTEASKVHSLIRLAIPAIALSVAVMLITVSVVSGFKGGVRNLIRVVGGDIVLNEFGKVFNDVENRLKAPYGMISAIEQLPRVSGVRTVVQSAGIVKTEDSYQGVSIIGLQTPWQRESFSALLQEGALPYFSSQDTVSNPIVLPASLAQSLSLKIGDRVNLYILSPQIKLRTFTLTGLLDLSGTTQPLALVPQSTLRKVLCLSPDVYSRLEIFSQEEDNVEAAVESITTLLRDSRYVKNQTIGLNTAKELHVNVYDWIAMLDSNAIILLSLMGLVCSFTLINCLLILILDRTYTIATLKALGMKDGAVMKLFIVISTQIIGTGLLWGNFLAFILCFLQQQFHLLRLDSAIYYLAYVPVEINPIHWLSVNLGAFTLCMLMLLLPVGIIAHITPSKSIKFE